MLNNDTIDITISPRKAKYNKQLFDAMLENYADPVETKTRKRHDYTLEENIIKSNYRANALNRFQSFSETVRNCLVTEALYKLFYESTSDELKSDNTNQSIMRKIVNEYVQDNGYNEVLARMRKASVPMCEMYNIIDNSVKNILEEVDKEDPATFTIKPEERDEFFKDLDYADTDNIEQAISDRVSDAMADFINTTNKEHDDITDTLKHAQEKIDDNQDEDADLKESYQMLAKSKVNNIRSAPKGVLYSMVSAMSESVLKHKDMQDEFMTEGHLDMDKIVDRTRLMYTFMEMLNTTRLDTIDESYIKDTIMNLKK